MSTEIALRPLSAAEPIAVLGRLAGRAEPVAVPTTSGPVLPNPRLRLDGTLGMVVLEFRDGVGRLAHSIPTAREIAAYRAAALSDAPMPIGTAAPRAGDPPAPAAAATATASPSGAVAATSAPTATAGTRPAAVPTTSTSS
jgi:hypothetical protein